MGPKKPYMLWQHGWATVVHPQPHKRGCMNAMMVIFPYKVGRVWVFDDEATGLVREPFVERVNDWIDRLVADIPNAEQGVQLLFSAQPFPGYALHVDHVKPEYGGHWYTCPDMDGLQGWLCPAMFKYFDVAPPQLFAKALPR